MNKAKASGYDTIDGVEWLFDIVDEKATNLYISKDVETSTITIPTEVTYKNVTYPVWKDKHYEDQCVCVLWLYQYPVCEYSR